MVITVFIFMKGVGLRRSVPSPIAHMFILSRVEFIYIVENNNAIEAFFKTFMQGQNQPFKSKKKQMRPPQNQGGQPPADNNQEQN